MTVVITLAYVTHEDLCKCFQGDTLLAVQAPSGTQLEVPIPDKVNAFFNSQQPGGGGEGGEISITHEDLCKCFQGDTLLAVQAPSGTQLGSTHTRQGKCSLSYERLCKPGECVCGRSAGAGVISLSPLLLSNCAQFKHVTNLLIGDVANWKCHQRLDEILIFFLPHYIGEISKVVFKKTTLSCNMPAKLNAFLFAQQTLAVMHVFHTA